jgi:hypothetical protein
MSAALDSEEANVSDVVLPTRVHAARDVDAYTADFGQTLGLELGTNGISEAT